MSDIKLRYFMIEDLGPEFSPDEVETIRTSAAEADDFFDGEFEYLEILTWGSGAGFRRGDVRQMHVIFEKASRETTRGLPELFEPDIEMWIETLGEDEDKCDLRRGDSIVHIPFGKEITRDIVVHELAHVVYNSFYDENGVNNKFRDHFKHLVMDSFRRFSETDDGMLNPEGLNARDVLRRFLEREDSFEKGLEKFRLFLESIKEKIDEAFATAVENLSQESKKSAKGRTLRPKKKKKEANASPSGDRITPQGGEGASTTLGGRRLAYKKTSEIERLLQKVEARCEKCGEVRSMYLHQKVCDSCIAKEIIRKHHAPR